MIRLFKSGNGNSRALALLFMTPALMGLTFFIALPFCIAFGLSFTSARSGSPLPVELVGFREYSRLFSDETFWRALWNNALFASAIVPFQTGAALGLALLLNLKLRGMPVFRSLFFMPVVFPMSLVAVIWMIIFAPGPNGMLNGLLGFFSAGTWEPVDFLHHESWALPAVVLTSLWQGVGFQMVVLLAGLGAIDSTLYEAAAIDGAGRWSRFRHITLPGLRSPLVFVVTVTTILSFRVFDQVRIMTGGGPKGATSTVIFEAVQAAFCSTRRLLTLRSWVWAWW